MGLSIPGPPHCPVDQRGKGFPHIISGPSQALQDGAGMAGTQTVGHLVPLADGSGGAALVRKEQEKPRFSSASSTIRVREKHRSSSLWLPPSTLSSTVTVFSTV